MKVARVDAFEDPLPEGAVARLGTGRFQQGGVWSLAFSPDGTRLLSGGDLPLHVWEAATGRRIHELRATFGAGFAVTFGKDHNEVYAVARNGTILHWPRVEKEQAGRWTSLGCAHGTLGFHGGKLVALDRGLLLRAKSQYEWRTNPIEEFEKLDLEDPAGFGGGRLAIATDRGEARIFEVPGAMLRARVPLGAVATAVALSSSGATLAAGFADGRVGVFDVPSRRQLAEWPAHPSAVAALAFSPDGQTIASGSGARIRVWNTATGGERLSLPTFDEPPARLSFHPDAPRIVTRSGLTLQEWDAETGAEMSSIPARGTWDDGSRMPETRFVALEDGGDWTVWDTALGKRTFRLPHDGVAAASSDGTRLFLISRGERDARLVELATGKELWSRDLPSDFREAPTLARFLPGDEWVLAGHTYDRVWLLDAKNKGETERVLAGPVAFSRDGARIAATAGNGDDVPRAVEIFTPRDKGRRWIVEQTMRFTRSAPIRAIAFAPFRPLVAIAMGDLIEVFPIERTKPIATFRGTEAHDLVFSPDGRRLASISWTSADVLLWDVPA